MAMTTLGFKGRRERPKEELRQPAGQTDAATEKEGREQSKRPTHDDN